MVDFSWLYLWPCFSSRGDSVPRGTVDDIWRHFWLLQVLVVYYWRVEARDAAKDPAMHRTDSSPPAIQNYQTHNLSSA